MSQYRVILDPNAKAGIEFRGGNRDLFLCPDPEVILSGPSDTGKTMTGCTKLHWNCQRYPGSQHALVRKTYASMPGSVCQTFGRIIAGSNVRVIGGDSPRLYTYPNGSKVWVGGMDNPDKTLSSERDTIYVSQAEELTQDEWEVLSSRCTGRAAKVKFPQLYGDCNPSGSKHWIRQRAATRSLTLLVSKHGDNPTLFHKDGSHVKDGEQVNGYLVKIGGARRMAALDRLTGVRGKRLRQGLWVTAEGAVYDTFDASVHVRIRVASEFKQCYLTLDEGYTNPAVILLVGVDSDGRWHVLKEFYQSGVLQETVVKMTLGWYKEWHCALAAVDEAAAGLIADLVAVGVYARGGKGRVIDGINRVQNRLSVAGDGLPRLTFDPGCVNCINEFESYVWQKDKPKDTPVKEFDHTSDALRYLADVLGEPDGSISSADDLVTTQCEAEPLVEARLNPKEFAL